MTWPLFFGLLAKSSVVAVVGMAASRWAVTRAADRVDILRLTVGLLAVLPLIALFGPQVSVSLPFLAEVGPVDLGSSLPGADPLWVGSTPQVAGFVASGVVWRPSAVAIVASLWAMGGLVVVARLALGVWTLSRWTGRGRPIHDPVWARQIEQLDGKTRPRVVASPEVHSPLSWGLSPGAILIDTGSLKTGSAAAAILAHEMAHLKRADWAFLILSRLVLAMFWFNPLVWWLTRSLVDRSEEAADAEAVSHVDRHAYARALIALATVPRSAKHPAGALAMAAQPHSLKTRIACLMNAPKADPRRPLVVGLTIAALIAVATPLAALDLHGPGLAPPTPPEAPAAPVPPMPPLPEAYREMVAPPAPPAPPEPPALPTDAMGMPSAPPAFSAPPAPPARPVQSLNTSTHTVWSNDNGRYIITTNGVTREATPEERVQMEAARRLADESRTIATHALAQAAEALGQAAAQRGQADAASARANSERARIQPAIQHAQRARVSADLARQRSVQAREQAQVQRVAGRAQMRDGAVQMHRGADQMRQEAVRLRDPAYRARQIEESRSQGRTVTDAELIALSPRLERQATEMHRRADDLAHRGARDALN